MMKAAEILYVRENKDITGLQIFNIVFLMFSLMIGSFLSISVSGITSKLYVPLIICNALLGISYHKYKAEGTLKTPVILLRVVSVLLCAMIISPLLIGSHFETVKALYTTKRHVFVDGVKESADNVLPHELPKNISEYYFSTDLGSLVQDYTPYADLIFRCSNADIDLYIAEARSKGMSLKDRNTIEQSGGQFDGDDAYRYLRYNLDISEDILNRLEPNEIRYFAEHGVSYGSSSQGCAFDRGNGYAIFWG